MPRLVLHSRQGAACHSSAGQDRPQGRPLQLEGGQTEAFPTEGLPSRYRLGLIERELEVSLGDGRQQWAAWESRDVSRWSAAKILSNELAGGHSQADRDLYPLPCSLPMRFQIHFLVDFLIRDEAFVLHGKATDFGRRYEADGARRLNRPWAASRNRVVLVSLLRPTQMLLVCLVAYPVVYLDALPGSLLGGELLNP